MAVGILSHEGESLVHRKRQAAPAPLLQAIAPYREGLVVAVECLFTWEWRADLCAQAGLAFALGHALAMPAIPGGKATTDPSASPKIAALRRGGRLPHAAVAPAQRRATRDRLRRRLHLRPKRAALWAHVPQTHSHDHRPALGTTRASKANRAGVAARFAAPAGQQRLAVALALLPDDDALRRGLAVALVKSAKPSAASPFARLRAIPGVGTLWAPVMREEIHDRRRCPRVQDGVAYGRLVKGAKDAAGKRDGPSGAKLGTASRPRAFAEAAGRCRRHNAAGPNYLAPLEHTPDQGTALTLLAHKPARALSSRRKRDTVLALHPCLQRSRSGAGEPGASRDPQREAPAPSGLGVLLGCVAARQGPPRPCPPAPSPWLGYPLWRLHRRRGSHKACGGCPSPEPDAHWRAGHAQPALGLGRYEGTAACRGRRA
jgi:hypothetical protein